MAHRAQDKIAILEGSLTLTEVTEMMYYMLGWTAFHPIKMATIIAVAVAILATLWHMSWMIYVRCKLMKLVASICNIGDILGLPEDELFTRAARAAKASKGG